MNAAYEGDAKDLVPLLTSEKINLSDTDESDLVEAYDYYVTVGELEGISFDEWKAALIEGLNTPTDLPKPINYNLRDSPLHAGDFIIVPGESSAGGLVGHNGLVIGPDRILHSPGNQSAGNATVTTNIKSFMNKYGFGNSRVYRPKRLPGGSVNMMAGWYALTTTFNSTGNTEVSNIYIDYSIPSGSMNLKAASPTYCSKLVYQAYAYGTGGSPIVPQPPKKSGIIPPKSLPSYFSQTPDYVGSF